MSSQENMSPANTDPEKAALDSAHTSASPASKTDESTLLKQEVAVPKPPMARQCPLLVLLLLAILAVTFVSASHGRAIVRGLRCGESKRHFQELLNSVDAAALHKVLHEHASESRYQHGIYQDDRTAMEALHQEDADVATSLVELARRQAGNTTVVTATETSIRVSTSTSVVDPSTTAPGTTSQSRVTDPTTTAPGSTSQSQAITRTPATSAAPTTQAPDLTTSATTPPANPTSAPTTAAAAPSKSAGQSTNVDSSPSSTLVTQGSTSGTSTSGTSTSGTSTSGSSTSGSPTSDTPRSTHSITQQTIYTTTFANGKVATVTQVTVVPGQVDETGSSGGSKTTTAKGSLQTNGAEAVKHVGLSGVLGALGLVVAGVL